MSTADTVTFSIDRTSLSLAPLVLSSADDATPLGIRDFSEPAIQHRIRYAPASDDLHGSQALGATLLQSAFNFDATTSVATTEAASRSLIAELRAALNQFSYEVTVTTADAPAEVWACDPGDVGAAQRSYEDLKTHHVVYPVSIPCHPVRS